MYQFRPFRNSDPPRLAEIWREQPPLRGLMQPVTTGLLEQLVFSKPYFDPAGLIVATHDAVPVGFAHGGFGPNDDKTTITTELGTTQLLMLRHEHQAAADELLHHSEGYLRSRGANVLYAGGIRPLDGFYLGLYGGSELPGVLANDSIFTAACRRNGYQEIDRVVVLQLELSRFRPPFSRSQRQLRRDTAIREEVDARPRSWWDACTTGAYNQHRFVLEPSQGGESLASVWFWDIEPMSSAWGIRSSGMRDLDVTGGRRRQGLATYILSEAFVRLATRGVARIEAQTMRANAPALALYAKFGFQQVDEGIVFRKG